MAMKKIIYTALTLTLTTLAGCYTQEPLAKQTPRNNKTYEIEYLFEHDGCKVYRFEDRGRDVYFTNCAGEVIGLTDSTQIRNPTKIIRKNK